MTMIFGTRRADADDDDDDDDDGVSNVEELEGSAVFDLEVEEEDADVEDFLGLGIMYALTRPNKMSCCKINKSVATKINGREKKRERERAKRILPYPGCECELRRAPRTNIC